MSKSSSVSPWAWVSTLYFAEGIPYFIVNVVSVMMFTRMGVPNGTMSLWTSMLYLPWVIKPLWSPFVDILRTRRWWTVAMQVVMAISFAAVTLSFPSPGPESVAAKTTGIGLFKFTIVLFYITAFASATHDIAADGFYMLALDQRRQDAFVGIRSTFYRLSSIFGQGVLVMAAGKLETTLGDIPQAWRLTIGFAAVLFALLSVYHAFILPHPASDRATATAKDATAVFGEFAEVFTMFFRKKCIWTALAFILIYRLPEALTLKLVGPFLLDPPSSGGLGLSTSQVGFINGTVGVAALLAGGIAGGLAVSRWGLRKLFLPMAAALTLPCAVYLYLSMAQFPKVWLIASCIAFEQLGYGFGFQAFMLYMMRFADGRFKTSHYALCTGFMALGMMLPGLVAGYIWEAAGSYTGFFVIVMICCAATFAVTAAAMRSLKTIGYD